MASITQAEVLAGAGIQKRYGGLVVLDGVSIAVRAGEILGVAGPNGAGKTTLFDILSGHIRASAGRVTLGSGDVTALPAHRRARLGLARTFQSPLVPTELTVGEALDSARVAYAPRCGADAVAHARELVRLHADDEQECGVLDTLARRKLLLACLLLREPSVLLLDEPCSGMVSDEIDEMDQIIRAITSTLSIGVIVVEHRLELLFAIADRVVVLDDGRVIADGPAAEVFEDPTVRAAYFEGPAAA